MVSAQKKHGTKSLVYWPVYCPSTACTQDVYGCVLKCTDRVRVPYIPGLTACQAGPSTARTQDVYWMYTERVMNVYGFLTHQD